MSPDDEQREGVFGFDAVGDGEDDPRAEGRRTREPPEAEQRAESVESALEAEIPTTSPENESAPADEFTLPGLSDSFAPTRANVDEAYRERFGPLRSYFRAHGAKYSDFQRILNQAHISASYDEYLARNAKIAGGLGVVGALLGVLITALLAQTGILAGIRAPVPVPYAVAAPIGEHRLLIAGVLLTPLTALVLAGGAWVGLKYYPKSIVSSRNQSLSIMLPHAIVYMYALSYGGMSLPEVFRAVANAEDTYGEMARECQTIVNDADIFGTDMYTALHQARSQTPNDSVEQFFDDLLSVLDAGGDLTMFLEDEAEEYLQEALEEQEIFLDTLSLLSEVFIVGFVAAPLFLVVILVVMSLVGAQMLAQLSLFVYVVIPFGMAGFIVLVDTFGEAFVERGRIELEERPLPTPSEELSDQDRFQTYQSQRRRDEYLEKLSDPLTSLRRQPLYSLAITVPLATLFVGALLALGWVTPTIESLLATPILTTAGLFVLPFLFVTVPLSVFHERKRRRETQLAERFPNTLSILSSANKMGVKLTDGLGLIATASSGLVATELRQVRNDIIWNGDPSQALLAMGARVQIPQLARTCRLLAEGLRSSGDISRVLTVAAEDARARHKLDQTRKREMRSYVAIVVMGYLVYLLVIVLLDANYLGPIGQTAKEQASYAGSAEGPMSFSNVPVEEFKVIFFHSALIQGLGTGLLAGKLTDNTLLSGLKYSIALVTLALITFTLA